MANSRQRQSRPAAKQPALWQIGLYLMLAGPLSYMFTSMVWPLTPPLTNEQRGQAFGRGLASVAAVIVGAVLVAVHFVRRRRR